MTARLEELSELVQAIDRALEREMNDQPATEEDLKELFGKGFHDAQAEAQERWGEPDAWRQSQRRTKSYTAADWAEIKAESEAVQAGFTAAMDAGEPPTSVMAMDAAEQHRRSIDRRFYDCTYQAHRGLADLYVSDPRFTASYDEIRVGMSEYVRAAIFANADRHSS